MLIPLCIANENSWRKTQPKLSGKGHQLLSVEEKQTRPQGYLSEAIRLLRSLSKSLSVFRSISTFRME